MGYLYYDPDMFDESYCHQCRKEHRRPRMMRVEYGECMYCGHWTYCNQLTEEWIQQVEKSWPFIDPNQLNLFPDYI